MHKYYKSFNVAITLYTIVSGEEREAEDQQRVIPALENVKLKSLVHAKQTTL